MRAAAIACLALTIGLAGCQTGDVSGRTAGLVRELSLAGFTPILGAPVGTNYRAAYYCPAERCGELVRVYVRSTPIARTGEVATMEEFARSGRVSLNGPIRLTSTPRNAEGESSGPVTVYKVYSNATFEHERVRPASGGGSMHVRIIGHITGNTANMVIAFSKSQQLTRRFARLAWLL